MKCPKCNEESFELTRKEKMKGMQSNVFIDFGRCSSKECDFYGQEIPK